MKILICDQQLMLAEALASALDARGYDVLAVTTTVSDPRHAAGDYVRMSACLACRLTSNRVGPTQFVRSRSVTPARRCWCCPRAPPLTRCLS